MNNVAQLGHNQPPHDALFSELNNLTENEIKHWLDGVPIENDGQMKAVDDLKKLVADIEKRAKAAKEIEFRPAKQKADEIAANFKPVLDESAKLRKGLAGLVEPYKIAKAKAIQAEQKRLAEIAAEKERAAQIAEDTADMTDIESRKVADELAKENRAAQRELSAATKQKPSGLRTRKVAVITSHSDFWHWMQKNDKQLVLDMLQTAATNYMKAGGLAPNGVSFETESYAI